MAINLAEKYANKVDERFALKELTNVGLNTDYEWEGVASINVYNVDTVPLNDYQKSGANRYGNADELGDTKTKYDLTTDKSFTFTIDKFYKTAQAKAKQAGKALARELDEVVIPFKDMQRLAVWNDAAVATGQVINATLSKTNAYATFLDMQEVLDDNKVPLENRVFYVTSAFHKYIKQDDSFIKAGDLSQKMLVKNQVGEIDGVRVVKVPKSYFSEGVAGILVYTKSTMSPSKLHDYRIHSNPPGISGDLVEGRIMLDTFVLEAKKKGVVVLSTATA